MGSKMLDARSWTNLELRGLLEDEESYVQYERTKRHLGLHPFHLTNLNVALREIFGSTLCKYDTKLKGIILSYKNPKLLSRLGTVLYDTCYIHIDIEADFYVFRPEVGNAMKGIVNKKSQDHVGILVHKAFNVSIPRPTDDPDWPGHSVEIGQEVRFTITCMDFKGRLPYIRGSMDASNYLEGCKLFEESFLKLVNDEAKPKKTSFSFDNGEDREDGTESGADRKVDAKNMDRTLHDDNIDEKVSSRKQKKLKKEYGEDELTMKRKKKQKLEGELRLTDNDSDFVESNQSNEYNNCGEKNSSRKSKKLKRENEEDKISTKKKKKSKVKVEEISSYDQFEINEEKIKFSELTNNVAEESPPQRSKKLKRESVRYSKKTSSTEEEYSPRKSKKLKKENDEIIHEKYKVKPKLEVEITYADEKFDAAYNNGTVKIKSEHAEERRKRRKDLKVEIPTSESDSDVNPVKRIKKAKNRSSGEKIKKRNKIKAEILSSDDESSATGGEQSVRTWIDNDNQNIKEEYRIKTEARSSEVSD